VLDRVGRGRTHQRVSKVFNAKRGGKGVLGGEKNPGESSKKMIDTSDSRKKKEEKKRRRTNKKGQPSGRDPREPL